METVLEVDSGAGCAVLGIYRIPLLTAQLKMPNMVNFVTHILIKLNQGRKSELIGTKFSAFCGEH